MGNEADGFELRREGKRHQYWVIVGGRFVAHVGRALIGQWVAGITGGIGVGGTFPTKEAAARAAIAALPKASR